MDAKTKEAIYEAVLKAALEMGPHLGEISWFGRNQITSTTIDETGELAFENIPESDFYDLTSPPMAENEFDALSFWKDRG